MGEITFDQLLEALDRLTPEQKQIVRKRLNEDKFATDLGGVLDAIDDSTLPHVEDEEIHITKP